jgi:outer membrane protein OmpA-like peptidoglycan-associated protein
VGVVLILGGCSAHQKPTAGMSAHRTVRSEDEARRTREQDLALLRRELTAVQSQTSERGVVLTIPDVLFEVDKAELKASAQRDLVSIAAFLKEHPDQKILIEDHTVSSGTVSNDHERFRRGTVVATFFLRKGVDPKRLEVRGLGENQPIASSTTTPGRQQNRRVEIVML